MEPTESSSIFVRTAEDAAGLLAPLFEGGEGELIAVLYLDSAQRLIQVGEYREEALPTRAIVTEALRLFAEALIVGRNHPNGDTAPSEADVQAARELADTARTLGIRLFDELIFAGGEMRSFRELGLL